MCNACDIKDDELMYLRKNLAHLITENYHLSKRIEGLLADNDALRAANSGLHSMASSLQQQQIRRKTGVM